MFVLWNGVDVTTASLDPFAYMSLCWCECDGCQFSTLFFQLFKAWSFVSVEMQVGSRQTRL